MGEVIATRYKRLNGHFITLKRGRRRPEPAYPIHGLSAKMEGATVMNLGAQHVSVAAGAALLLVCGLLYPKRRGRDLVAPASIGVALGTVVYPLLLGLVMGYR